jgi:hypothetical protein
MESFPKARGITGHPATKGDVVIGNDVWLGTGATVLSGVTIGDGAVVGAHALVAKAVPPYAIVAGNPARLIRLRFSRKIIAQLLALQWWYWPEEQVNALAPLLCSDRINEFIAAAHILTRNASDGRDTPIKIKSKKSKKRRR